MSDINPYETPESEVSDLRDADLAYFTVGPAKLVLLSLCTFGLYELYWFYRNWQCVKHRLDLDIWPFWRAFFAPLWLFSLTAHVRDHGRQVGLSTSLSPIAVGGAYLAISILWRLPDPYWLVSMLSFLPLLLVQDAADRVAVAVDGKDPQLQRLNVWNWTALVVGGGLLILSLIGTFMVPLEG